MSDWPYYLGIWFFGSFFVIILWAGDSALRNSGPPKPTRLGKVLGFIFLAPLRLYFLVGMGICYGIGKLLFKESDYD